MADTACELFWDGSDYANMDALIDGSAKVYVDYECHYDKSGNMTAYDSCYLEFHTDMMVQPTALILTPHSSAKKQRKYLPRSVQLVGIDAQGHETTLLTQGDVFSTSNPQEVTLQIDTTQNYQYYRVILTQSDSSSGRIRLGEMQLRGNIVPLTYRTGSGSEQTTDYHELRKHQVGWPGGVYTVSRDTTLDSTPLDIQGNATLILQDNVTLTVTRGINIRSGATLTIASQSGGTGHLVASRSDSGIAAVIGGNVTIDGGVIDVTCTTRGWTTAARSRSPRSPGKAMCSCTGPTPRATSSPRTRHTPLPSRAKATCARSTGRPTRSPLARPSPAQPRARIRAAASP